MTNFWYVSQSNEIFVDTDNFSRSIKHTTARLLGAIKCGRLRVSDIEFHTSKNENHIHTLITLAEPMQAIERYTWAIVLHSDIYRAASTIMRQLYGVAAADVFITPTRFKREPDVICECDSKHKAQTMLTCPAAFQLRGEDRIRGFFGLPDNSNWTLEDIAAFVKSQSGELF